MGGVAGEDGDLLFLTAWSGHVPHSPHSGHPPPLCTASLGKPVLPIFFIRIKKCVGTGR